MGRTLDMIVAAAPQVTKPTWTREGSAFSMLWEPEKGDLAMQAVAKRADEYALALKLHLLEVARSPHPRYPGHEGIYFRTEPLA